MTPQASQRIVGALEAHFAGTDPRGLSVAMGAHTIGLSTSRVYKACRYAGVRAQALLDAELRKRLEERALTHTDQQLADALGYTTVTGFRMAVRRLYGKKIDQVRVDIAQAGL